MERELNHPRPEIPHGPAKSFSEAIGRAPKEGIGEKPPEAETKKKRDEDDGEKDRHETD